MATMMSAKSVQGMSLARPARRSLVVMNNAKIPKTDISKQGLNTIEDDVIRNNLMGRSRVMKTKEWRDASGQKGKGKGVFMYEDKYGANVDGYSPIYAPEQWSDTGDTYKLGAKGLIAWAGLVVVLLAIGVNLIISTSQLGN